MTTIADEFKTTGVAPVIVVLKQPVAAGASAAASAAADLEKYFTRSELSQESHLVAEAVAKKGARQAASARDLTVTSATLRRSARRLERPTVARRPVPEVEPPPLVRYYPNLGVAYGTVTRAGLSALRSDKRVEKVSGAPRIGLIRPKRVAAARLTRKLTWGIKELRVPELWAQGLQGDGVIVGHLDTGVDGRHPALRRAIDEFAEFDLFGRQVVPDPAPHDTEDHGTHTAATIAGRPVGGRNIGVAPKARLAAGIVIEGGQVIARVLGGMDWIVGRGARVLSMSLGLPGWVEDFRVLTQILRARGVLPVFAVGNEGPGTSRSPGNYEEALSVGAYDEERAIAWFSSSQRFRRRRDPLVPDIVAPGVDVISARPGGGYQVMDGTSMATPHVAGLAALLFQAKPSATPDQVESAIFGSCELGSGMAPDRANRGFPDAVRALESLAPGSVARRISSRPTGRKRTTSRRRRKPRARRRRVA